MSRQLATTVAVARLPEATNQIQRIVIAREMLAGR
jgi:hypothetical protein